MHSPLIAKDEENPKDAFVSLQEELNKLNSIMRKAVFYDKMKSVTCLLALMTQVSHLFRLKSLIIPSNNASIKDQQEYKNHYTKMMIALMLLKT